MNLVALTRYHLLAWLHRYLWLAIPVGGDEFLKLLVLAFDTWDTPLVSPTMLDD